MKHDFKRKHLEYIRRIGLDDFELEPLNKARKDVGLPEIPDNFKPFGLSKINHLMLNTKTGEVIFMNNKIGQAFLAAKNMDEFIKETDKMRAVYKNKLEKQAGLKDVYLKAGVGVQNTHTHLESLLNKKVLDPAARAMRERAHKLLKSSHSNSSETANKARHLAGIGKKIEDIQNDSAGIADKAYNLYQPVAEPVAAAKAILLNKILGVG